MTDPRALDPVAAFGVARVLVVDEDAVGRARVMQTLTAAGFGASGVDGGRAALKTIARGGVDLVVLEPSLPGLSGTDLLAELRRRTAVPIIVLASQASEDDVVLGLELGADDYLLKPANPRELVARVRAALRRVPPSDPARTPAGCDALTGLPTSLPFLRALAQALTGCRPHATKVTVMLIGLDRFSSVNQAHGYGTGDEALIAVASRLRELAGEGASVCRLGGDQFAVACPETPWETGATDVAGHVLEGLHHPIPAGQDVVSITASIGVVIGDSPATDPEALVTNAGFAMRWAKERGGGRYEVFDETRRRETVDRDKLELELRLALSASHLRLLYQPQIDLLTGETVGMEALLRWRHPDRGMISPADFLGVAESSGLIVPIGLWSFDEASRQARAWALQLHRAPVRVSVNLSARQLREPGLVRDVTATLARNRVDPRLMCVEISAATLDEYPETSLIAQALRVAGIAVEVDNVHASGVSGGWVTNLPVDGFKLDRRLAAAVDPDAPGGPDSIAMAVMRAAVDQSRGRPIRVAAEGVETAGQLRVLRSLGLGCAQGFHFSAPLLPGAATHHLRHTRGW